LKIDYPRFRQEKIDGSIKTINHILGNYEKNNLQMLSDISNSINIIDETILSRNYKSKHITSLLDYFSNIYRNDICFVLHEEEKFYSYTRRDIIMFFRGESVHNKGTIQLKNKQKILRRFLNEEKTIQVWFSIRKDFVAAGLIRAEDETDSKTPYAESIKTDKDEIQLGTLESISFSIIIEIANMLMSGSLKWRKMIITPDKTHDFQPTGIVTIDENLKNQSQKWKEWNVKIKKK